MTSITKLTYFNLSREYLSYILLLFVILLSFITNDYAINNTNFMKFLYIEKIKYIIYIVLFTSFSILLPMIKIRTKEISNISLLIILIYLFLFIKLPFTGVEIETFIKVLLVLPLFFYDNLDFIYKKIIYFILFSFLVFALIYANDRLVFDGYLIRLIYNSFDPNISSMYLLLGFFLARKIDSKLLMLIFFIMGITTLSRNFMLAIVVLYFIGYIKNIKYLRKLLKINFISLLIIFNFMIVGLSYGFQYINYSDGSSADTTRLTNVADESNAQRFAANRAVIDELFSSTENFIFGLGLAYYDNPSYDIHHKAHNGTLDFLSMYGFVYTSLYFSLLYFLFNKVKNFENIEYAFSYGVFSLFLAGLLGGVYLILFVFILKFKGCESTKYFKKIRFGSREK